MAINFKELKTELLSDENHILSVREEGILLRVEKHIDALIKSKATPEVFIFHIDTDVVEFKYDIGGFDGRFNKGYISLSLAENRKTVLKRHLLDRYKDAGWYVTKKGIVYEFREN